MITLDVPLGERRYEVHIGTLPVAEAAGRLAAALGAPTGVAVLVDGQLGAISPRAGQLCAALAARLPRVERFELPPGESGKNLAAIERTCQWLAERGYDRGAAIVGVGGGAASDHAGFAAAVYLRGIDFALMPTTLLGMVDASVGGKTGVDLPAGKNLVGAFHQPRVVIADLGFLATLPGRQLAAGMAEIVKAGLISDAGLLGRIEADVAGGRTFTLAALAPTIAAAVRAKVEVVTGDERESGRRAILNFGHTLGHALEAESHYDLLHGEAVSLGMIAALALGSARGISDPDLRPRTTRLLASLGLPVDVEWRVSPAVLARIEVDKKRRGDRVGFVFVPRAGEARVEDLDLEDLRRELPAALATTSPAPGGAPPPDETSR
jgi:3-dehydroquinate synthase